MDSLMFEDKSGQSELFDIESTNSDSEEISDSDEEGTWANVIKQESSGLSRCWDNISTVSALKKPTFTKSKLGEVIAKKKNDEIDLNDVYVDIGHYNAEINSSVRKMADQDQFLQNSEIGPEFHRLHEVPTAAVDKVEARIRRLKEKEKTTGPKWYNMPAPEMTDELRRDIEVIKMRSVLDPKQFYKKNTMQSDIKYFQVGRIVESSADFYNSRIPKKGRKKTLVDELLANAEFKKYNKKRYKEIVTKTKATDIKARRHANRLKKNK